MILCIRGVYDFLGDILTWSSEIGVFDTVPRLLRKVCSSTLHLMSA